MREDFVPFMAKPVEAQNMKNPSLGKLRSLFQINQVNKEENQIKNLTSNNFATHLSALRNFRKLAKWPRGVHVVGQRVNKAEEIFASPFSPCEIFASLFLPYETGECELRNACETTTEEKQFRNPIFALRNSPCVIFKYFPADSIRFFISRYFVKLPILSL